MASGPPHPIAALATWNFERVARYTQGHQPPFMDLHINKGGPTLLHSGLHAFQNWPRIHSDCLTLREGTAPLSWYSESSFGIDIPAQGQIQVQLSQCRTCGPQRWQEAFACMILYTGCMPWSSSQGMVLRRPRQNKLTPFGRTSFSLGRCLLRPRPDYLSQHLCVYAPY